MKRTSLKSTPPKQQQGVAILVITILLLFVATIGTITVGRVGVIEQKAVGTDVRSKEVYSAATGGLEYGVGWFGENYADLSWSDNDGDGRSCDGDTASPDALGNTDLNADSYSRNVTYTLRNCVDESPVIVTVASQATAQGDSHVQKTVSIDVMLGSTSVFSRTVTDTDPSVFQGPPIMVEGCIGEDWETGESYQGVRGNPEVYPDSETNIAIGTARGEAACLDPGHLDLHGGTMEELSPSTSLAQATFDVPGFDPSRPCNGLERSDFSSDEEFIYHCEENHVYAMLRGMEHDNPERVFVVDNAGTADSSTRPILGQPGEQSYPRYGDQPGWNGNNWNDSLGSENEPVILYFDRSVGCPKINGGPVIHGLVYYAANDCTAHGWGNAEIHGTVALRGDMQSFNANTEIYGNPVDFGGGGENSEREITIGLAEEDRFSEIPGSWRDF